MVHFAPNLSASPVLESPEYVGSAFQDLCLILMALHHAIYLISPFLSIVNSKKTNTCVLHMSTPDNTLSQASLWPFPPR